MIDAAKIKEHMEVLGSDGKHVGRVDHMEGTDKIKLARSDPDAHGGHHHFIPLTWVAKVDQHVHLSKASQDVNTHWEHER